MGGIDPEKLLRYRATFICQYGRCCCIVWPSFFVDCTFRKNLGNLRKFFRQMVYRPPWQKISRTLMILCYPVTQLTCYPLTSLPCIFVTLLPCYLVTVFPYNPVTLSHGYPVTLLTLIPCYLDTLLPCYPVTLLPC